jgi:hypothetical protein
LKLALFSLIESMGSNPDKYTSLTYHKNDNHNSLSSTDKDIGNLLDMKRRKEVILPPPPYDEYIIEDCKAIVLTSRKALQFAY